MPHQVPLDRPDPGPGPRLDLDLGPDPLDLGPDPLDLGPDPLDLGPDPLDLLPVDPIYPEHHLQKKPECQLQLLV